MQTPPVSLTGCFRGAPLYQQLPWFLLMQGSLSALRVAGPRPQFSALVQRVFFCRILGVHLFFFLGTILFKTGDRGIPVCEWKHSLVTWMCFSEDFHCFFSFLVRNDYKFIGSCRNSTGRFHWPFTQLPPVLIPYGISIWHFLGELLPSGQGFLGSSSWCSVPIALGWELPWLEDVIGWWDSCPCSAMILIRRHLTHLSLVSL